MTFAALWLGFSAIQAQAQSTLSSEESGALDLGNSLAHHAALPVPTVITEPAVGYGLGLALLFFSSPESAAKNANVDASANASDAAPKASAPPNITGIGGFATGTHSYGYGLMHFHTWDDDRIRYFGAVGKVGLHLNYYDASNHSHAYQLDGLALSQRVLFRLGDSPWYVGPSYTYFDARTRFGPVLPNSLQGISSEQRVGKAGLIVDYDTRDNLFFPNYGTYGEVEASLARGALGSSSSFSMLTAKGYKWLPLAPAWVLGMRLDTGFSGGDIPFFAQPYVTLRGVSQAKFQDRNQITTELELRWNVTPRWSVLGFGGAGKAYGRLHDFGEAQTAFGVGTGFRYLIAKKLGLAVGVDVAHGPGQNAFYVQVGSAWR
ncbi:BamA/TamA family outer membrane protein [Paraburkholderia bonniea]|uniref:BamA/TamA family outer membrane protein n=1 Tax=Paraburkholderia bonniea TaxID=2152891 RepID=UPI0025723B62|nr:BamA/TamA family outer membrane protein [Paraburkholderia bonniea]WJF91970.1 BamA/TamA family outer membrane protein [Paraburkholderia bonniea]WJF95289.1 BamA/TamA family outer membrane protein [Paraburkholderia bonniea]